MGPLLGAAIAGVGDILGGIFGGHSAREQNREEREWQERMANTQYQRGVKDMRAAGLNPAMIYGKGPMSAPVSGGARQSEGEPMARSIGAAAERTAGLALMKAQIADIASAAELKRQEKNESVARQESVEWSTQRSRNEFQLQTGGQSLEAWQQYYVDKANMELAHLMAQNSNLSAQEAEAVARRLMIGAQQRMLEYGESAAIALKKYWSIMGVTGVALEKGSEVFARVAGTLGLAGLGRKLFSPGQKDGGANSAKSGERRSNAMEWYNNQSEDIGR